jgi:Glycosyl hydrolase 36 superfamily, catalytic domain
MFAFRSPVRLAPGKSVTLRYAYGYDYPDAIASLVARYRRAKAPLQASEAQWRNYVPQVDLGSHYRWLSRELQWDAYMLRSDTTYEACAGEHILSQGGYYQYAFGWQAAYRDPLQLMLPMIYEDPELAREVIIYSAEEQTEGSDLIPYGRLSSCAPLALGTSDDLDLWLLLAAEEYGLATRDLSFFNTQVAWTGGGRATLWAHLEQAFTHEESMHGPHGDYLSGTNGDWSDLSTTQLGMTESSLVTAQAAYIYPRVAQLADLGHQSAFAAALRAAGAKDAQTVANEWVGRGWYARGWSGTAQLGVGTIFEEPQPWAILAGIPTPARATTLVANIRRFLTGVGAAGGPSKIGSAESPGANDPGATEHSTPAPASGSAVFIGGVWYSLNGWLTWALGTLDGEVPHASEYAFSELVRNTLATHATAFPDSWDGILSVDDVCSAWYSQNPSECGAGLTTAYDTQIPHQDAWTLWDTIELAGISSTERGFRIVPHLPMSTFSVRFQDAGVSSRPGVLEGYIRTLASGALAMQVARPADAGRHGVVVYVGKRRVRSHVLDGLVEFTLDTTARRPANWAVVAR